MILSPDAPCRCGSGRPYRRCCGRPDPAPPDEATVLAELRGIAADTIRQVAAELGPDTDEATLLALANERLERVVASHNRRPRPVFGGLSPVQVHRLLDADWSDAGGAIRLRGDLPLDRLERSDILANARMLLGLAIERGGLGATQRGNLQLEVVATLAARWQYDDPIFDLIITRSKRLREDELDPLHRVRIVAGLAGLLRKRGPRFLATRKAKELVAPARAGELFALLFRTWLREFNLAYNRGLDWPELQEQAGFTLLRLPRAAADWRSAGQLLTDVVLPFALERAPGPRAGYDPAPHVLAAHLLDPLVGFGLLERRTEETGRSLREERYRATSLAREVIRFDL